MIMAAFVCILGFAAGAVYVRLAEGVSAEEKITDSEYVNQILDGVAYDEAEGARVWCDEWYKYTVLEGNTLRLYVELIADADSMDAEYIYTSKDEMEIMDAVLDIHGEMEKDFFTDGYVGYREMQNGYPTGGVASFCYDSEGRLFYATFRQGDSYDLDEGQFGDLNEAYELALNAIIEKYGAEKIYITSDYDPTAYTIIHLPDAGMCYRFEITAQYTTSAGDVVDAVFYPNINLFDLQNEGVESTLCF